MHTGPGTFGAFPQMHRCFGQCVHILLTQRTTFHSLQFPCLCQATRRNFALNSSFCWLQGAYYEAHQMIFLWLWGGTVTLLPHKSTWPLTESSSFLRQGNWSSSPVNCEGHPCGTKVHTLANRDHSQSRGECWKHRVVKLEGIRRVERCLLSVSSLSVL